MRCGIDSVEIARIERMLGESPGDDLAKIFSAQELSDSGSGPGRAASLAARYAAKEACIKLFPRELALGQIEPAQFAVERDAYGAPQIVCGANAQQRCLADHPESHRRENVCARVRSGGGGVCAGGFRRRRSCRYQAASCSTRCRFDVA